MGKHYDYDQLPGWTKGIVKLTKAQKETLRKSGHLALYTSWVRSKRSARFNAKKAKESKKVVLFDIEKKSDKSTMTDPLKETDDNLRLQKKIEAMEKTLVEL